MGKNDGKIPCMYLFMYKVLKESSAHKFYISYAQTKEIINRRFGRIPNKYHLKFLKEMEEYKLLKKDGPIKNSRYEFIGNIIEKQLSNSSSILPIF